MYSRTAIHDSVADWKIDGSKGRQFSLREMPEGNALTEPEDCETDICDHWDPESIREYTVLLSIE